MLKDNEPSLYFLVKIIYLYVWKRLWKDVYRYGLLLTPGFFWDAYTPNAYLTQAFMMYMVVSAYR